MLYFPHAWNHCSAIGSVSQLSADSLTQRQTHVQDCRQTLLFQHWFVLHCWEEISLKLWPCNIAVLSWGPPMELMVIPVVWQVYLTYHDVTVLIRAQNVSFKDNVLYMRQILPTEWIKGKATTLIWTFLAIGTFYWDFQSGLFSEKCWYCGISANFLFAIAHFQVVFISLHSQLVVF